LIKAGLKWYNDVVKFKINFKEKDMSIPNDPMILLSYINTQLRDFYQSLEELCKALSVSQDEIVSKLKIIEYEYNAELNRFV
jgi:hypothetical protein